MTTAEDVRTLILCFLEQSLMAHGIVASEVADETDLRATGLIDSFGFVRLLGELERQLGIPVDLAQLDPAQVTKIGALARHIASVDRR